MFKEFPKALYMGGYAEAAYVIAADTDVEAAARQAGYAGVGEAVATTESDQGEKAKRGRKPNEKAN